MAKPGDCVVFYSGGRSHLAWLAAREAGWRPAFFVYFDGGETHPGTFGDVSRASLMRLHAELMGVRLEIFPSPKLPPGSRAYDMADILGIIRSEAPFSALVTGNSACVGGRKKLEEVKAACAANKLRAVLPLAGLTPAGLAAEAARLGCSFRQVAVPAGAPGAPGAECGPVPPAGRLSDPRSHVAVFGSPAFGGGRITPRGLKEIRFEGGRAAAFTPAVIRRARAGSR